MAIEKLYRCDCYTEGVVVEADKEEQHVYMSFWAYGQPVVNSWKNRLRYIWKIIKTGTPYSDMVVLEIKTARQMAQDILDATVVTPVTGDGTK